MKPNIRLSVVALSVMGLVGVCGCSALHKKATGCIELIATQRTQDLRLLFRSEQVLARLKAKRACLIQYGGKHIEISVGDGAVLDQVILEFRKAPYDGQIKVVSQDSVVQTSLVNYNPSEQSKIKVAGGDLIFIQGRE